MANNNVSILITAKDMTAGAFSSVRSSLNRVTSMMTSLQAGVAAIGGGALAANVIKTGASFEQMGVSMKTVLGSAQAADEAMSWIKDFAVSTPYELEEVNNAFLKLSSYGIDATENLRWLGDTAGAMGKPLNQAVEMVADAITGEFERLKEFGVRARQEGDQVTFAWSENGTELTTTVSKTSEDINTALQGIFERFEGGMEEQSTTMSGIVSNIKDQWSEFMQKIAEGGAFDGVKAALEEVRKKLEEWANDGTTDALAEKINVGFQKAVTVIEFAVKGVLAFKAGIDAIIVVGGKAVELLSLGFEKVAGVLSTITSGISTVFGWLGKGANAIGLDGLGDFFDGAKKQTDKLTEYYKGAEDMFKNLAKTASEAVDSALKRIVEISEAMEKTGELSKKVLDAMQEASRKAHKDMADEAIKNYERVKAAFLEANALTQMPGAFSSGGGDDFSVRNRTFGFADGGVISGGFKAFANGGVVTRPTFGLIGEGRYNEAVVPLPDGSRIPVDLRSADGSKAAGGDVHIHITALDAKSFEQYVRANPQAIKNLLLDDLRYDGDISKAVKKVRS